MKLYLFVYGTVEFDKSGKFLVNKHLGRLANGLVQHFSHIVYVAERWAKRFPSGYQQKLDAKVEIGIWGVQKDRMNIFQKFRNLLYKFYWVAKNLRSPGIAMLFYPQISVIIPAMICKMRGIPFFTYIGSDWEEVGPFMINSVKRGSIFMGLYKKLLQWSEKVITRNAQFVLVHGAKVEARVRQYNPRVYQTVPMLELSPEDFFYRMDTCKRMPIQLLYVGALGPRKGISLLLQAVARLKQEGYAVRANLVGGGDAAYRQQLEKEVEELGIVDEVAFVGYVHQWDELLQYYRDADIFVLPTFGEGFPRVIYEAQSQSLPVVASGISTIASVLTDGNNVVLFTPGSAEALTEAIRKIITDAQLRAKVIAGGYEFVRSKITRDTTVKQIMDLLRKHELSPDANIIKEKMQYQKAEEKGK